MAMGGNMAGGGPRFTVGGVISAGLSAAFGNFFRFLAVILLVGVPVVLLLGVGIAAMGGTPTGAGTGIKLTIEGGGGAQVLFGLFAVVLGMLAYVLIQAALTFGTLQHLNGRVPAIRACLAGGFQVLPRAFLATLVLVVVFVLVAAVAGMVFGALLSGAGAAGGLVVVLLGGGLLYVYAVIWVFIPAIVVERAGVLQCFSRSMALTKGRRWGIFAILVLIALANGLVSYLTQLLAQVAPIAGTLIDLAVALFFLALGPVLATVGYYYLRAEKEGVAIDDVVRVFD